MSDEKTLEAAIDAIFHSCGLVGDLSRARLTFAGLLLRGIEGERERCAGIARSNLDEWNSAGWMACAEDILRRIENPTVSEKSR